MRQVTGVHDEYAPGQDVLYVAARAPRPGFTKSRLGKSIGYDRAATLYAAFVRDLAARLSRAPFRVSWYVTPDDAWSELAPLASTGRSWGVDDRSVLVQPPGDWTERQRHLFATARLRRERRIILIASDSPQLDLDLIVEAFERLHRDDLVLGPTDDGGYYLIGMRTPADRSTPRPWDVLTGVRMSTGTVLEEIVARASGLRLRASLLAPTFDVDEAADLERLVPMALLRDDLTATRATLESLGLDASPVGAEVQVSGAPVTLGGAR